MHNPLITFIVPVYNCKDYLKRCIASVVNTDYSHMELLLIDDGSTDGSGPICDQQARIYPFIRVIHKSNQGVSVSRNLGLKKALGEYVVFLDSDDYLGKEFIQFALPKLSDHPDIIFYQYCKSTNDIVKQQIMPDSFVYGEKDANYLIEQMLMPSDNLFVRSTLFSPCGKLYRKAFLLENFIYYNTKMRLCEDVDFNIRVLKNVKSACYIPCIEYYYFKNMESAGRKYYPDILRENKQNVEVIKESLIGLLNDERVIQAFYYSVLYRIWECCYLDILHRNNKDSMPIIGNKLKSLRYEAPYRDVYKLFPKLKKHMHRKQRLYLGLLYYKKFLLLCILSKIRVVIKKVVKK